MKDFLYYVTYQCQGKTKAYAVMATTEYEAIKIIEANEMYGYGSGYQASRCVDGMMRVR